MSVSPFLELSLNELYDILKLRSEIFVVEQKCPYLDPDGLDKKALHLTAKTDEGEIVGTLRILPAGAAQPDAAMIGRVVISPKYRGQNLCRPMLNMAIAYIKDSLCEGRIMVQAQAHLSELYGSVGFKAVGEIYPEDGIPHVDMLLLLP